MDNAQPMLDFFSDETRRNPYPAYGQLRVTSPLLQIPPPFNGWLVLDFATVKRVLADHETFSSRVPGPQSWFIFSDPPAHSNLRALVTRAFTPRMVANLEPLVEKLAHQLLDAAANRTQLDIAMEFSVPLALNVIATILGIPPEDWPRYRRWSDAILALGNVRTGGPRAEQAIRDFRIATAEMSEYLGQIIEQRRSQPREDLLTSLIEAEVEGERLFHEEILGFFQLLIVAGQETTSDLINNAVLCLLEYPDQFQRLRSQPELLPSAIEEVLRYRAPIQWVTRVARHNVEFPGARISAGEFVMPVIGSANRDPLQFPDADRFDIARSPNPHIAFGHGIHFCLGSALSRLEAKVALSALMSRYPNSEWTLDQPWRPRQPLQVHGPSNLLVCL